MPFTGTGTVHDLFGATDDVELALWQYLFDIDLVTAWEAEERPVNDPDPARAARRARVRDTRRSSTSSGSACSTSTPRSPLGRTVRAPRP